MQKSTTLEELKELQKLYRRIIFRATRSLEEVNRNIVFLEEQLKNEQKYVYVYGGYCSPDSEESIKNDHINKSIEEEFGGPVDIFYEAWEVFKKSQQK